RHSKLAYLSPMEFEAKAVLASLAVHQTGSSSRPIAIWAGITGDDLEVFVRGWGACITPEAFRHDLVGGS
ncbi:hypothetical protein, partial [Acidocella facilis]|uniref:hypothetical protein n=1 Tax=Acidocella facilis TaxID=525 RepID=UPI001F3F7FAE